MSTLGMMRVPAGGGGAEKAAVPPAASNDEGEGKPRATKTVEDGLDELNAYKAKHGHGHLNLNAWEEKNGLLVRKLPLPDGPPPLPPPTHARAVATEVEEIAANINKARTHREEEAPASVAGSQIQEEVRAQLDSDTFLFDLADFDLDEAMQTTPETPLTDDAATDTATDALSLPPMDEVLPFQTEIPSTVDAAALHDIGLTLEDDLELTNFPLQNVFDDDIEASGATLLGCLDEADRMAEGAEINATLTRGHDGGAEMEGVWEVLSEKPKRKRKKKQQTSAEDQVRMQRASSKPKCRKRKKPQISAEDQLRMKRAAANLRELGLTRDTRSKDSKGKICTVCGKFWKEFRLTIDGKQIPHRIMAEEQGGPQFRFCPLADDCSIYTQYLERKNAKNVKRVKKCRAKPNK